MVHRTLDRPAHRDAATSDPEGFLVHDGLMVIDEVQRVPDLWLAMKAVVDEDPRPGRFLLTGSARLLALSTLPDTLPGRTDTIELWPLSQGEIDGEPDGFVDAAFAGGTDLLENFVLGELGRQLTWCEPVVRLFHYRDRDQREVDAVLEDLSGRVVGIEVKAGATVRADDFRGLRVLRDRLGDRFVAGFVLHCGRDRLGFGDRLGCLPISDLWTTAP